ncbi:MAG: hypothetical protein EKK42_03160 [Pseudonocardiaceae bacterium]|nr:MAG: hypothetical protein EKK42_03160 [Pseudonocardiaceae bacterium]
MRAHEEKRARERREIRERIEAGAKALRKLGAARQFADNPREAYMLFCIAAVFDTLALHSDRVPSVMVSDALRASHYLVEPLRGDRRGRTGRPEGGHPPEPP